MQQFMQKIYGEWQSLTFGYLIYQWSIYYTPQEGNYGKEKCAIHPEM